MYSGFEQINTGRITVTGSSLLEKGVLTVGRLEQILSFCIGWKVSLITWRFYTCLPVCAHRNEETQGVCAPVHVCMHISRTIPTECLEGKGTPRTQVLDFSQHHGDGPGLPSKSSSCTWNRGGPLGIWSRCGAPALEAPQTPDSNTGASCSELLPQAPE